MDGQDETSASGMKKKEKIILGTVVFFSYLVCRGIVSFFPETEEAVTGVFGVFLIFLSIVYVTCQVSKNAQKQDLTFLDRLKETMDDYFEDADTIKEKYKGSIGACSAIDRWKQKMTECADKIRERYAQDGETEELWDTFDRFEEDLNRGWHAMRKGRNPYDSDSMKLKDLPYLERSGNNKWVREL